MIDVSTIHGPCPRCSGRRVYAIDADRNLWRCVPNAVPIPFLLEHVRQHDATSDECDVTYNPGPQVNMNV